MNNHHGIIVRITSVSFIHYYYILYFSWSPYDIGAREINKNNIRVAEVWMDDFKYLFYDR